MGTGSEALLVASKEIGIEVNTEKTVIFMSREQNAGQNYSYNVKITNNSWKM
jgi:hypothetical protein